MGRRLLHLSVSLALLAGPACAGCGGAAASKPSTQGPTRSATTAAASPEAPAVTAALQAVFAHPTPAQCTTAMSVDYVRQTFGSLTHGERKVASTALRVCQIHQRQRAAMAASLREVAVQDLAVQGDSATAALRGSNGYPLAVRLTRRGSGWVLDAPGRPHELGSGRQVAPDGSLYAYRIPPGFHAARAGIGPVDVTGAAYSTAVASPKASQRGEGVGVAQTATTRPYRDAAQLRGAIPGFTPRLRVAAQRAGQALLAPPTVVQVAGRPALRWLTVGARLTHEATLVLSSAPPVVVLVSCTWARTAADEQVVTRGCNALLASLQVS
jgi:hypothetical protein